MPSLSRVTGIVIRVIAVFLVLIPPRAFAQPITFDWSRRFGGILNDGKGAVAVDAQGNVLVSGTFQGTVDFGGGPITSQGSSDIFLLKLDADGDFVFADGFGSTGDDAVIGVAVGVDGSGNVYLTGTFSGSVDFGGGALVSSGVSDIFLASFEADGTHRWSKRFGDTQREYARDLAVAPNGDLIIVGFFQGTIDFGGGPFTSGDFCDSAFVARFDNSGNHEWSLERHGPCDPGMSVDYDAGAVSLGPTGNCCVALNRLICTTFDCNSAGCAVEEFDASGSSLGVFDTSHGNPVIDVAIDTDGFIYVTGRYEELGDDTPYRVFSKYSPAHVQMWKRVYALGVGIDAIAANVDGSVLGLGTFFGTIDCGDGPMTSAGDGDIFALRLPAAGEPPKSQRIGGTGREVARSTAGAEPGAFLLTGDFAGTTDVGGQSLTSAGGTDVLVAKIRFPAEVAVAIAEFQAKAEDGVAVLASRFRSDLGVVAVNVYRSPNAGAYRPRQIASINEIRGETFAFVDRDVMPGQSYRYQIGVVDADGEFFSDVVTVSIATIELELFQNQPNPFNPTTTIRFVLPAPERVVVSVYDASGSRVRTLLDEDLAQGSHEVAWDGRDEAGAPVGSGVYFYRLTVGKFSESKKMVLLK